MRRSVICRCMHALQIICRVARNCVALIKAKTKTYFAINSLDFAILLIMPNFLILDEFFLRGNILGRA